MTVEPTITSSSPGAGALLRLIRDGQASTRAELVALTGLARSTVAQRMDALLSSGSSCRPAAASPPAAARRRCSRSTATPAWSSSADLGATHSRLAVTDLGGEVLVEGAEEIAISEGPEAVLAWLEKTFDDLLASVGRQHEDVRGIGVGVPGPVEFATGTPVAPPIMPGWDGYRVSDRLADYFGAPTLVDNDVNIMALGEHWKAWRAYDHLLFVKVGDRHRLRDHHRRPDPPRRAGRGRRHRPHPRPRQRGDLPLRQPRLPRGGRRRRRDGGAAARGGHRRAELARRRPPRARRPAGRDAARAPGRTRAGRGARRLGQLLQPGRDRDRRRHRPCRRAPAGRRPRGRLPARRPARHALAAHRPLGARRSRRRDRRRRHGDRARARAGRRRPDAGAEHRRASRAGAEASYPSAPMPELPEAERARRQIDRAAGPRDRRRRRSRHVRLPAARARRDRRRAGRPDARAQPPARQVPLGGDERPGARAASRDGRADRRRRAARARQLGPVRARVRRRRPARAARQAPARPRAAGAGPLPRRPGRGRDRPRRVPRAGRARHGADQGAAARPGRARRGRQPAGGRDALARPAVAAATGGRAERRSSTGCAASCAPRPARRSAAAACTRAT